MDLPLCPPTCHGRTQAWYPQTGLESALPALLNQVVQDCITQREHQIRLALTRQSSTTTQWYLTADFAATPLTKASVGGSPLDQAGFAMIVQCRIGSFVTGNVLVRCKRIPAWYENRCPFCNFDNEETLEHIVFYCPFWAQARTLHLSSIIQEIDDLSITSTLVFDQKRLSWLLGGNHDNRGLPKWMPPPPPVPDLQASNNNHNSGTDISTTIVDDAPSLAGSDSDSGTVASETSTDCALPSGNSCGSLAVARFLTVVARLRAVTIRSRWSQFQSEAASYRVPTSTTGQRPNG